MTKVQYYCAASLDGYIADADDGLEWLTGYEGSFEGEGAEPGPMSGGGSYEAFYERVGALVTGSTTYEWVLEHISDESWPYKGKPCWVLSSRDLRIPQAGGVDVRIIEAEVSEIHDAVVDAAGGGNVWIVGGGNVASQYADAGLLDELHLTVVPVVIGTGKPLFERPLAAGPLQLLGTRVFETGMVELRYGIRR